MARLDTFEEAFTRFIEDFIDDQGRSKYDLRISEMMVKGSKSLILDFTDIYNHDADLARAILENPKGLTPIFNSIIKEKLRIRDPLFADNLNRVNVRIVNLIDTTSLRDIPKVDLGWLIQVEGIITAVTDPEPEPINAAFVCPRCGEITRVPQEGFTLITPKDCGIIGCKNKSFSPDDIDRNTSTYKYVQTAYLQERPEELSPGVIPTSLPIHLQDDLIDTISPGDRAKVVGVIEAIPVKPRKLDYKKMLIGNSMVVENKDFNIDVTDEELKAFTEIAKHNDAIKWMIESFAPGIYGWEHIKEVLLLVQFGGVAKSIGDLDVRGNINVLLLGDPGTAKSQLLRYSHKLALRSVFSTGKGVTNAGLTAAVVKEDEKFVLRAGSMALADMGVCCIDEGEKMNKDDRNSIHTPMEQQIIPIQKGGLNATLNARCATLMACNPTDGRYNIYKTISENIKDFPDSLLTRFDFIFIMPDVIDEKSDQRIMRRIMRLDKAKHERRIPFDTLKKYIIYSKRFNPVVPEEVGEYLGSEFLKKRQEQKDNTGLKVSWRQLESLERACEARARAHLREAVTMEDAEAIIRLFEIYVTATWTDPFTGKVDMSVYEGLPPDSRIKQAEYLPNIIKSMYRDGKGIPGPDAHLYVRRRDLVNELISRGKMDDHSANKVIDMSQKMDLIWSPGPDRIKLSEAGGNRMLGDESQTLNTG